MFKLIFKEPAIMLVCLIVDLLHQADCEVYILSFWLSSLLLNDLLIAGLLSFRLDLFAEFGILSGDFGVGGCTCWDLVHEAHELLDQILIIEANWLEESIFGWHNFPEDA